MKRIQSYFSVVAVVLSFATLSGCGNAAGGSADVNQAAASRDSQMQAMSAQRQGGGSGAKSGGAAAKAGQSAQK